MRVDPLGSLPVDLSPLAREEFLHEVRYYAARGQGLKFIAAIIEALERVQRAPRAWPQVGANPALRRPLCAHVSTVASGDYEWDDTKATANLSKHGVSFDEAALALDMDPHSKGRPP